MGGARRGRAALREAWMWPSPGGAQDLRGPSGGARVGGTQDPPAEMGLSVEDLETTAQEVLGKLRSRQPFQSKWDTAAFIILLVFISECGLGLRSPISFPALCAAQGLIWTLIPPQAPCSCCCCLLASTAAAAPAAAVAPPDPRR